MVSGKQGANCATHSKTDRPGEPTGQENTCRARKTHDMTGLQTCPYRTNSEPHRQTCERAVSKRVASARDALNVAGREGQVIRVAAQDQDRVRDSPHFALDGPARRVCHEDRFTS
jgi:hypothetical protein